MVFAFLAPDCLCAFILRAAPRRRIVSRRDFAFLPVVCALLLRLPPTVSLAARGLMALPRKLRAGHTFSGTGTTPVIVSAHPDVDLLFVCESD